MSANYVSNRNKLFFHILRRSMRFNQRALWGKSVNEEPLVEIVSSSEKALRQHYNKVYERKQTFKTAVDLKVSDALRNVSLEFDVLIIHSSIICFHDSTGPCGNARRSKIIPMQFLS